MFQLYSKACEYAIRALIYAAPKNTRERFAAHEVCQHAEIPESYTRKVFQALVRGKFLESVRGPGGGYRLRDEPANISVLRVVTAVDGKDAFDRCVMGLNKCEDDNPCPLHSVWALAKESLLSEMKARTIQDLMKAVEPNRGLDSADLLKPHPHSNSKKKRK